MPLLYRAFHGGSPVLFLAISFILGIAASSAIGHFVSQLWVEIPLFLFIVFLLWLLLRRKGASVSMLPVALVAMLFVLLGSAAYALHASAPDVVWPKSKKLWCGNIVSVSETKATKRCVVALVAYKEGNRRVRVREQVVVSILKRARPSCRLRPGEALMFYARIGNPGPYVLPNGFDYAKWLRRNGIAGTCFVTNRWMRLSAESSEKLLQRQSLLMRCRLRSLQLREKLLGQYARLPADSAGRKVLAALTLGDKSGMTSSIRELYARTGTSHVLALSGLHLGMLISLLMLLLRPLLRFKRLKLPVFLSAIALIWCFAFLTGLSISLLRSAVMYTLWCLFMCRGRHGRSLNNLALAAFLLLIVHPDTLFDVGFQLSFLSVLAILSGMPMLDVLFPPARKGRVFIDFLFVSVVAQLATAPLVAYYFNSYSVYFILGNCIAIPCTCLLLTFSMLFLMCSGFSFMQELVGRVLACVLDVLHGGLSAVARLPFSSLWVSPSWLSVCVCYVVLVLLFVLLRRKCESMLRARVPCC